MLQVGLERAAAADGRDAVSACALRAASQWLQRLEACRFAGRAREARLPWSEAAVFLRVFTCWVILLQAAGLVVTASEDSTLRVWRLADGACLRTLTGHTARVRAVVEVGGGRVASGGEDGVLRVWDVLSGRQLQQTPTGGGGNTCIAALWGNRVATGHLTGEIRLWSLGGGGGAAGVLLGHTQRVTSLAVVGGGTAQRLLASGSADRSVRLWDVDAGSCTASLSGHMRSVRCLADLGGGRLLSGSWDRSLRVWNTATGACLAVVFNAHEDGPRGVTTCACALPGGAATGTVGSIVQRWTWDESAGALRPAGAALQLEYGNVYSLALAAPGPDGAQMLLAGFWDGTLAVLLGSSAGGSLQMQAALRDGGHTIFGLVVIMTKDDM